MAVRTESQKIRCRVFLSERFRVAVVRGSAVLVVNLKTGPTQLGQLSLSDAAPLAGVNIKLQTLSPQLRPSSGGDEGGVTRLF